MTPRKAVAMFISREIDRQASEMQQALGEVTIRANRIEALTKVLLLYQPRAADREQAKTVILDEVHEHDSAAGAATMASIASAMTTDAGAGDAAWLADQNASMAAAEIEAGFQRIDAAPTLTINEPVPAMGTSDGVALSAGESEGDVTPVASLSPTALEGQSEPAADAGHSLATTWQSEPEPLDPTIEAIHQQGLKELDAIAADPAPVVSQSEASPASTALAAPAKRVFQQPLKAADVEALEPEQPARKSVKRVVMPKNKLNPAGILETKEEQKPAVLASAEPLFDRVMNLWAETDLDFKTIARNAECSVEMISAFVSKARKHNDPRGFARTERGKAPVFKKPVEISRADGAPISGASKPPAKKPIIEDASPVSHHLSAEDLHLLGISKGVVVLDFPNRKVIGIRGTFTSQVETMRVLEKLNAGDMLPIALLAKAGGYSSEDVFKMTLPRLAEKLSDVGVIMTNLKGFGVRITRSASV